MLSCLFLEDLWSPAERGLTSIWLSCVFVTFPICVVGQEWYLIVLIPDLCLPLYFGTLTLNGCLMLCHCQTFGIKCAIFNDYGNLRDNQNSLATIMA